MKCPEYELWSFGSDATVICLFVFNIEWVGHPSSQKALGTGPAIKAWRLAKAGFFISSLVSGKKS